MKIMASGPITSWQIDVETVERMILFSWAPNHCRWWLQPPKLKDSFLFGRNSMSNIDSILKSRDITLPTKDCLVKSMAFPVVIYECESWTIKKAELWRTDAFELWCWRRLLRVLWTARRQPVSPKGNQPWIFIGRTDAEAEAPILWPPDVKSRLTGKDTDGGKAEGRRRKWWQRMRWFDASLTQWTRVWANSRRYWSTGKSGVLQSMGLQIGRHDLATEQ